MSFKEILEELSDEISEVYDLELAEEMTDIFEDLTSKIDEDLKQYWSLVKKLATIEKERDKLRKELEEERITKESMTRSFRTATDVAMEVIGEEREFREKVEKEIDQAEYDKEYYANQLMEYIDQFF